MTSVQRPPAGWWQASDGNWYPPELHPGPVAPPTVPSVVGQLPQLRAEPAPEDREPSRTQTRKIALIAAVVILLAVGGVLAVALHHSPMKANAPNSSPTTNPIPALSSAWQQSTLTFISAAQQVNSAYLSTTQDMQRQGQSISSDSTQYSSDLAATNCSLTSPDYVSCASQSDQAATQMLADENAANAAIQQDFLTIDAQASQLLGICHTYLSQMGTLAWTPTLLKPAAALGAAVTRWGNNWQQIGTINPANATALAPLLTSVLAQDKTNMGTDLVTLAGMLGVTNPAIVTVH